MEIVIYGKQNCQWCDAAKNLCERKNLKYSYVDVINDLTPETRSHLFNNVFQGARTVPQIIVDGILIGGYDMFEGYIAGKKL